MKHNNIFGQWLVIVNGGQLLYTHRTEDKTVLYEAGKCLVRIGDHETVVPCDPSDFENLETILIHAQEA